MGKPAKVRASTSAMAFKVREIQSTPNPNAAKFVVDRPVTEKPVSILHPGDAEQHPLARRLFEIPGVCAVLLLGDFVTVNKTPDAKWPAIKAQVKRVLHQGA